MHKALELKGRTLHIRWVLGPCALLALACGCSADDAAGNGGATGGAAPGTGGTVATGGSGGGNDASGGSGGSSGSGGSDAVGTGGGNTTSGSPGCGASSAPESGRHTIDVDGLSREYIIDIPEDYDPNHPYSVVFGWHWRFADAAQVADGEGASFGPYYGLKALADGSAIFVSPEGLSKNGTTGWADENGEDIAFATAMLDRFESELCVDTDRVFSTGFSFGGMFSYALGCALADRFRAIAPISGALFSGCQDGNEPIAMWGAHGVTDEVVLIPNGRDARDEFIQRNGCSTSSTPTEPSGCVSYNDCEAGSPLVWCEYNDGHWPPAFAAEATWNFFSGF